MDPSDLAIGMPFILINRIPAGFVRTRLIHNSSNPDTGTTCRRPNAAYPLRLTRSSPLRGLDNHSLGA